jgi:hypothetical protein
MHDNRKDDERIEMIEKLVREIHQRQVEFTLPALADVKKTIYGNGKPGLCEIVTKLDTKINTTSWAFSIAISALAVIIAIAEFLFKYK